MMIVMTVESLKYGMDSQRKECVSLTYGETIATLNAEWRDWNQVVANIV